MNVLHSVAAVALVAFASCGVFVVTLASSLAAGSRLLTELTGFD